MVLQYILPRFCTPQNSPLPAVFIVTSASRLAPKKSQQEDVRIFTSEKGRRKLKHLFYSTSTSKKGWGGQQK